MSNNILSKSRPGGWIAGALACAGLLLTPVMPQAAAPVVGAPAPAWTLTDINGQTVRLSDLRGKVVLMNFFATWCVPCQWEVPDFVALQNQYGSEGLVIVGVGAQQNAATLSSFAAANNINYTVCPSISSVLYDYDVLPRGAIPVSAIINREGILAGWYLYYHPKSFFEEELQPHLATGAAPKLATLLSGRNLVVRWPETVTGFVLERRGGWGNGHSWSAVSSGIIQSNGFNQFVVSTQTGSGFFRLRKL